MKSVYKRVLCLLLVLLMLPLSLVELAVPTNAAYENTYRNTGDMRADIIGVALTQVGYSEAADGTTKYGVWYGHPTVAWCGVFVAWCANQAGIPTSIIKKQGFANAAAFGLETFTAHERTPQPGDLYFRGSAHVGIVYYVEGDYFYTLEGNTWDSDPTHRVMSKRKDLYSSSFKFASPAYEGGPGCSHNYVTGCDTAHPHNQYKKCTKCGDQYYTGTTQALDTCQECKMANCKHSSYGGWKNLDSTYHHATCNNCGMIKVEKHHWNEGVITPKNDAADGELCVYTCTTCGATKTIDLSLAPGDINRDGIVNNQDVEELLWWLLFPEAFEIFCDADFNDDDVINNMDVEQLLWHTLFPESCPLSA